MAPKNGLEKFLLQWPKCFIRGVDLAILLKGSAQAHYGIVNRAIKNGLLIPLRRDFYLIGELYRKASLDAFELAPLIYGPSYISFESALSYHGWIPEAVYTMTSACVRRSITFQTAVAIFSYKRIPAAQFYLGVQRVASQGSATFIADPWKALADMLYVQRRPWNTLEDLSEDLRVEKESMISHNRALLQTLSNEYPSKRVRTFLRKIIMELER